jgi:hypothetical protein
MLAPYASASDAARPFLNAILAHPKADGTPPHTPSLWTALDPQSPPNP